MAKPSKTVTTVAAPGDTLALEISGAATAIGEDTLTFATASLDSVSGSNKTKATASLELTAYANTATGGVSYVGADTMVAATGWDSVKVKTKTEVSSESGVMTTFTTVKAKGDGEADYMTIKAKVHESSAADLVTSGEGNTAHLALSTSAVADDALGVVSGQTLAIGDTLSTTSFDTLIVLGQATDPAGLHGNFAVLTADSTALGENTSALITAGAFTTDASISIGLSMYAVVA